MCITQRYRLDAAIPTAPAPFRSSQMLRVRMIMRKNPRAAEESAQYNTAPPHPWCTPQQSGEQSPQFLTKNIHRSRPESPSTDPSRATDSIPA